MPLHSIIPSFTFDIAVESQTIVNANATSSGLQHAQAQSSLFQSLFIFGVFLPVIIWPLLPSTSEVVSYRILAFSSLVQFVLALLWSVCDTVTDTDDGLRLSLQQTWGAFIGPFLCCCVTLGIIGHGADKCGKRLGKEGFDIPAYVTVGTLPIASFMLGKYLLNKSSTTFTIAGLVLMGVAWKPGTELAMTAYYYFMARRISSLHWLPQNGSKTHFNPWWSHALRFIWVGYTFLLVYISLATIYFAHGCQLQPGQSYPIDG